MNIIEDLGSKLLNSVRLNEPMAEHTSWQVGGPADYYVCPVNLEELIEIVNYCCQHKLPFYILGNGTNLLVLDGGIRGMVINIGPAFSYVRPDGEKLFAGAGTPMTLLAFTAAEEKLAGLEFAVGIPGSLGGAVIMNAGAFGGYIGSRVGSVKLIDCTGNPFTLEGDQLSFGYRTSNLIGKGVIIEIRLDLEFGNQAESKRMFSLSV